MKTLSIILIAFLGLTLSCKQSECNSDKSTDLNYIQTEEFAKRNRPFSQAVIHGDIIYVSGQIGDLATTGKLIEGGVIPETNQAMKNIKTILEQNGSSMNNVIKCTCMLASIDEYKTMSMEYSKSFPNQKPARSTFAGTGLAMDARIEIECMASISKK